MARSRNAGRILSFMMMSGLLAFPGLSPGQAGARARQEHAAPKADDPAGADETLRAIDEDYRRQFVQLRRRRLERLARLAEIQSPADAGATYEQLFRLAMPTISG